jgi:hypothetical protein
MTNFLQATERIIADTVAKNAAETDKSGIFPQPAIDAMREAGLLGLISAPSVGGLGQDIRAGAMVVEKLAQECASTAMIVCMHYCACAVIERYGPLEVRKQLAQGKHLSGHRRALQREMPTAFVSMQRKAGLPLRATQRFMFGRASLLPQQGQARCGWCREASTAFRSKAILTVSACAATIQYQ